MSLSIALVFDIERARDSKLEGDCFESGVEISSTSSNLTIGRTKTRSSLDVFTHRALKWLSLQRIEQSWIVMSEGPVVLKVTHATVRAQMETLLSMMGMVTSPHVISDHGIGD